MTRGARRTLATAAAAALTLGASTLTAGTDTTTDSPGHLSPRTVERLYTVCIQGAPITPDTHERWVASCRERASGGLT
jgi:hypothetical protein